MSRILVIRLGALGDFVQSFGPFAAIRAHHPDANVTLLTTAPFAELARQAPWFLDDVCGGCAAALVESSRNFPAAAPTARI